jgi:hypothetical protein
MIVKSQTLKLAEPFITEKGDVIQEAVVAYEAYGIEVILFEWYRAEVLVRNQDFNPAKFVMSQRNRLFLMLLFPGLFFFF